MNIIKSTEGLNKLYDQFKDKFEKNCSPSFHNLLWQIIVNEAYGDRTVAFCPVVGMENRITIGVAQQDEPGYYPTQVGFEMSVTWKEAGDICYTLNEEIFGLTPKLSVAIVASSMRKDKAENES